MNSNNQNYRSLRSFIFISSFILFIIVLSLFALLANDASADDKTLLYSYETGGDIRKVSMSDDGNLLAVGSFDDNFYMFEKSSSSPKWTFSAQDDINAAAMSANGNYAAACANTKDKRLYFFNTNSNTPLWSYTNTKGSVGSDKYVDVDISDDGEYIIVGHVNTYVLLFDKDSSTPLWEFKCNANAYTVAVSGDGEYAVVGSNDHKVYFFDTDSATPVWTYTTGGEVRSVDISDDGEYISAGTKDGKLHFFQKDSSTPSWSYNAGAQVSSTSLDSEGESIAAASLDGKFFLFDRGSSTPLWSHTNGGENKAVKMSVDGEYFVAGSYDRKVYYFSRDSSTPLWTETTDEEIFTVAISGNGDYVGVGSFDNSAYYFKTIHKPIAIIDSISPNPALEGRLVDMTGHGVDNKHEINEYRWRSSIDGELGEEESFSSSELSVGAHVIYYSVKDDASYWSNEVSQVVNIHTEPTAVISSITPNPALNSEVTQCTGIGNDDGFIQRYVWSSNLDGEFYNGSNPTFAYSSFSLGEHTITMRVQDNYDVWSNATTMTLDIHSIPNAYIQSISPNPALDTDTIDYLGYGEDEGSISSDQWTLSKDGNDIYNGTEPPSPLLTGLYIIGYRVQDNYGEWSQVASTSLIIHQKPTAILDPSIPKEITDGDSIHLKGSGTDDGSIARYVWTSSLSGVLQNSTNADMILSNLSIGRHIISFQVQDNYGAWSDVAVVEVNVKEKMILFREIGPFPVFVYVAVLCVTSIISLVVVIQRRKSDSSLTSRPPTRPMNIVRPQYPQQTIAQRQQTLPQQPLAQQAPPAAPNQQFPGQPYTQSPPQQPSQQMQQQPPQQIPQQPSQQSQPQSSQQYPPAYGAQQSTIWKCPQCGKDSEMQHHFCMDCGYKRP